jgi:flagellar assembly factor FliW
MNPKQKANELVTKIYCLEQPFLSFEGAKRIAIIAVDEVLKTKISTPQDYGASWTYWMQVKDEIEKL